MNNNSSIAVLLTTFNSEKYLSQQIGSILNQTNQEWTLYINDDCSTDSTLQIIDHYVENNRNKIIKLSLGTQKLGAADNFVSMLNEVGSQYYMFCDHDDVWLPSKIDDSIKQMRMMENKFPGSAILVHTNLKVVDENLNIVNDSFYKITKINPDYFGSFNYLGVANCVTGCTMLINDIAKKSIPFYPSNVVMHDWWIAVNISKIGVISYIPQATMLYRQHSSNVLGVQKTGIYYLIFNITKLKKIFLIDLRKYQQLKLIGYGSIIKYIYYKLLFQLMRFIKN